jgi:hypothetical protein
MCRPRQVVTRCIVVGEMMKGQPKPLDQSAERVVVTDHRHDPPRLPRQPHPRPPRLDGCA